MSIRVQEITVAGRRCRKCKVTFDDEPVGTGRVTQVKTVPVCFCGAKTVPVRCTIKYLEAAVVTPKDKNLSPGARLDAKSRAATKGDPMREQDGLGDPRESQPEENPNAYAMHEPPARMELLADLLKETHRIEKHAAIMEDALDRTHRLLRDKQERYDALADRAVKAERALVDCEEKDNALPAAVYLESLDERYIRQLRSDNEEARSF